MLLNAIKSHSDSGGADVSTYSVEAGKTTSVYVGNEMPLK